jgi:hypothetical protein
VGSEAVGLGVEGVCSSVGWVELEAGGEASGSSEAEGTKEVAGSSWGHSQTAGVSRGVVGIAENLDGGVGFGGVWVAGGNTAASVGPGEAAAVVGIAGRVGVQGHGERKVGVGRWPVVGIASTVAQGDGEEAEELVVVVGVGRSAGDAAAVAAAASRIGYRHNHSSRTEQTVQREDAAAELAEEGSIASCKFRTQAAGRDCGSRQQTSKRSNPSGEGAEEEDQEVAAAVADCTMAVAKMDFFA